MKNDLRNVTRRWNKFTCWKLVNFIYFFLSCISKFCSFFSSLNVIKTIYKFAISDVLSLLFFVEKKRDLKIQSKLKYNITSWMTTLRQEESIISMDVNIIGNDSFDCLQMFSLFDFLCKNFLLSGFNMSCFLVNIKTKTLTMTWIWIK
jgi:hypothetical protein